MIGEKISVLKRTRQQFIDQQLSAGELKLVEDHCISQLVEQEESRTKVGYRRRVSPELLASISSGIAGSGNII